MKTLRRARASVEQDGNGAAPHRVHEERLSTEEVRQRAVSGAAIDVLRGIGGRSVGLIGTLVLARLLTPRDFGVVAFGTTLVMFSNVLTDGGIGSALIRRVEAPERADLKALLAFQLSIATALAAVVAAALFPFGELGRVTALMVIALPLTAVRVPGMILLERRLEYRPLALVEIVEAFVFYGWAIVMVGAAGWGVWGLASANVVRAFAGSAVLIAMIPSGRVLPSHSWRRVRTMLGFGIRYQAAGVTNMVRDQGVNALIAVVLGVSALGIWSVAYRILQIPLLFLISLWRVSFPGMSRLVAAREEIGETIERVLAVVSIASGVILAPLVAASAAWVPALFGSRWTDVAPVIPPACLHLMVIGPISVALVGYLSAVGEASAVLRATIVGVPLTAAVVIPLLLVMGVPAVGFGWIAGGIGEAAILIVTARRYASFRIVPYLLRPTVLACAAAGLGWLTAAGMGETAVGGLVGALAAFALYLAGLWIWDRAHLLDSFQLFVRGFRDAVDVVPRPKLSSAPPSILAQARDKGLGRAATLGLNIVRTQTLERMRSDRQHVFISHTVHNTGAAQVVTDVIDDFAAARRPGCVHLVAPRITPDELRRLRAAGVRTDGVAVVGERLTRLQLGLRRTDFVLLNTVAIRENYQQLVLRSLETGRLEHAFWFIHEDVSQLDHVAPLFSDEAHLRRIGRLIDAHRLTVLVPSEQMRRNFQHLLAVDGVEKILLRVAVDEKFKRARSAHEYEEVRFLISGTPFDGRKGQPLAIAAFSEFLHASFARSPSSYRDFSLVLVGIGDDYVSQQIRGIGTNVLGNRLTIHPHVSRERALEITSGCNAVICCSLNEAFGLYVAEGMAMGHVVLRNDVCGVDEQLRDGKNGFRIDSGDVKQFAAVLERVLNKATTSSSDLQRMGRVSQELIAPFHHHSYLEPLTALEHARAASAGPSPD